MKTLICSLIVACAAFAISGCQPDNPSPNTGTPPPDTQALVVRGQVNGVLKQATEISAYQQDGMLSIMASEGMEVGWVLNFPETLQPGQTQVLNEGSDEAGVLFVSQGGETGYLSVSGSITVTEKDVATQRIRGTFQGELYNDEGTLTVTNGYFNVNYVQ